MAVSDPSAPSTTDPMEQMSIVVQGGLFRDGETAVARNCRHWRSLFPDAEIILAISATDLLDQPSRGVLNGLRAAPHVASDTRVTAALSLLDDCCDAIVLARPALPLPPIKFDTDRPNNINLQIAAAQAGLAIASRRYTLRVRNDLTFASASFLQQYRAGIAINRWGPEVFAERVLVGSLFTVNPYSYERLPFHVSDWFHFGLTRDIHDLWQCAEMDLADATFFNTRPAPDEALFRERLFRTRLAVEQHLCFNLVRKRCPEARLDFHSDLHSIDLSLDLLCANFVICDLGNALCSLSRYALEIGNPGRAAHCITAADWNDMARTTAGERYAIARRRGHDARYPETRALPHYYPPTTLFAAKAIALPHGIIATGVTGVVSFGPYDTLLQGSYRASVKTSLLRGPGEIVLRATCDVGERILGETRVTVADDMTLEVRFEIVGPVAHNVEIVVEAFQLTEICITGLVIDHDTSAPPDRPPAIDRSGMQSGKSANRSRRMRRWLAKRLLR